MQTPEILSYPIGKLIPYSRNSKTHPKEQVDKIARQIAEVGFLQPIVVDKDLVIIAGHGRFLAAQALGLKEVPVIVADHLTEQQSMAWRIADNKVSESPFDLPLLAFDLGTLERQEIDLTLTGMDIEEVRSVLSSLSTSDADPNFKEGSESDQSQLDERAQIECPHCGMSFGKP